jgi:ribosomal protein S18 acetylase RimI-like enzyme
VSAERFHTVRVLGPYGPEDNARADAKRMAEIQTIAWHNWLREHGVAEADIMATLVSDANSDADVDARESRVRQAFARNDLGEAVLYLGAYATTDEMVGFVKFLISEENSHLVMYLAEADVLPDYQGRQAERPDDQNLARKMIYAAIAQVRDPEAVLSLSVLGSNARARRLYEHLGLQIAEDLEEVFEITNPDGTVVLEDAHVTMEGSLQAAKRILEQDLNL